MQLPKATDTKPAVLIFSHPSIFLKSNWLSGIPTAIYKVYEIKYSYLHSTQGKKKIAFLLVLWHAISVILDILSDNTENEILVPDSGKNPIDKNLCHTFLLQLSRLFSQNY